MHKRILAIVTLLCAIPLLAFAGTGQQQINTWVQSPGGSIQVDSYAAQTSKNGSLWQSYSSSTANNTVTITPATGYFVNELIIDGTPQNISSLQATGTILNSTNVPALAISSTDAAPSIWVNFLRAQLSFTVNAGSGYIVFPSGTQPNVYSGPTYRVFEFIPAKGQYIQSINPSSSANLMYTTTPSSLPAAVNQKVIVTVSSITGAATLSATVGGTSSLVLPTGVAAGASCDACHIAQGLDNGGTAIYQPWSSSIHKANGVFCAACHQGASTGAHPGIIQCASCHSGAAHPDTSAFTGTNSCQACHSTAAAPHSGKEGCVDCHSVARNAGTNYVQDNSGVRAIVPEFNKTSHHIFNGTSVAPTDAQCVACHLEGKVSVGANGATNQIVINIAYHMYDNKIHLRNAQTDADLAWDPQAGDSASLTNLDNFCLSCHSAAGATSTQSLAIQHLLSSSRPFVGAPKATAHNPFGDLLSNSYDKQTRPAVVDVNSQFATTNFSHHAVKGPRYTTRHSSTAVAAWQSYSSATQHSTDPTSSAAPRFNSSTQRTLFDGAVGGASLFNASYVPLDTALAGASIGDDSQLHCGDCHTVGQWKVGSSTNADGSATTAAIGAHGSNNEYMLRNTKGTDKLAGLGTFICFNCHNDKAGGNTNGGYYSGAYWNNTTGKWVTATGSLHLSIHGGGSSVQYGSGSGCIENSYGLAFTDFSSAVHNNKSWAASWASPTNGSSILIGSGGVAQNAVNGTGNNVPGTDAKINFQNVLNGTQYVFFDASGNFAGLYASMATGGSFLPGYANAGNGNPSNLATGSGNPGANPVDLVFDADGTIINTNYFAGTGRNHFSGGNIFGNGCLNCHNVGRTGFGGIHGGNLTYTTGYAAGVDHEVTGQAAVAETQSTYRFMPGLGNYGYVPAGSGKEEATYTSDPSTGIGTVVTPASVAVTGKAAWEAWNGVGTSTEGGCYTNSYAKQNAGWSGCNHHGNGGVNDGGPGGTQPVGFGNGEPPTKTQSSGQVGRTLYY
ncbi:MAG: hypothetical protein P4L44_13630 [Oryzomonas sp.]|uniref:hypothetical protein n=1 Tax=Oryzomonas sp. TaxID=2855186 RepID=UPI002845702D|nr:hypothetical protein [Oryzomonas sp.]MDR3580996.1 hypothetical protein [Oryzomonas sp.]